MSIRLDPATKKSLDQIARHEKRSKSFLAAVAIASYIDLYEAQVAGIKKAIVSADAGKGIPHTKVRAWVESLGTDKELPVPIK
jgi:RHH-type transcriptional regulator, rel operon repressor / antitoxin RelB